jgi:hypothetical protein
VQIGDRFKFDKSKGFDEEPIIKTKQWTLTNPKIKNPKIKNPTKTKKLSNTLTPKKQNHTKQTKL